MMTPDSKGIMICPVCHHPIRSTAEHCPHCHAERHFGPLTLETAVYALAGLVLAPALSTLLIPLSLWSIPIALIGLGTGFALSHYRYNVERWIRSKTSR